MLARFWTMERFIVAVRVGEDTTFGKIIELAEEAQDSKSNAGALSTGSRNTILRLFCTGIIVWLFSQSRTGHYDSCP